MLLIVLSHYVHKTYKVFVSMVFVGTGEIATPTTPHENYERIKTNTLQQGKGFET